MSKGKTLNEKRENKRRRRRKKNEERKRREDEREGNKINVAIKVVRK